MRTDTVVETSGVVVVVLQTVVLVLDELVVLVLVELLVLLVVELLVLLLVELLVLLLVELLVDVLLVVLELLLVLVLLEHVVVSVCAFPGEARTPKTTMVPTTSPNQERESNAVLRRPNRHLPEIPIPRLLTSVMDIDAPVIWPETRTFALHLPT